LQKKAEKICLCFENKFSDLEKLSQVLLSSLFAVAKKIMF